MNNQNGEINALISSICTDVADELLLGYGFTRTQPETATVFESESETINAVLSSAGEGIKTLTTIQFDSATAACMLRGHKTPSSQPDWLDLCGELNNQLAGKIKNKMLGYGCQLMLGLPSSFSGKSVTVCPPDKACVHEILYAASFGSAIICIYISTHPEFEILDEANSELSGEENAGTLSFF